MLHLSGISKTYPGNIAALQDVSLSIPKGMFGLLGPNGAGKSSLMRTLATLQEPDAGSITFDGIDVLKDKTALRRTLGYLPQHFGAYPRTSALTMLKHFAALKGIHGKQGDQAAENLLVKTNLWDARHRSIDKFSGGMRQRYGIAQALIGDPTLVIVDEPTAGLDPAERRRFHNLLGELSADVVVLLSTHIVDDVEDICPHIAIMGSGRILVAGESKTLIESLEGTLWILEGATKEQLADIRASYQVLSTRVKIGGTEVRLLADRPPAGAMAARATLEDVYFRSLLDHNQLSALE